LQVPEELYENVATTNKYPTATKTATKSEDVSSMRKTKNGKLLIQKTL
jgi:hypothetical protein